MASNQAVRYAYIKAGNAVEEVRRLGALQTSLPDGGADAFLAHFLRAAEGEPTLVLSIHFGASSANLSVTDKDEWVRLGNVQARSYYWYSRLLLRFGKIGTQPLGTFMTRIRVSLKMLCHLAMFRPHRVLCSLSGFPLWAAFLSTRLISIPLVCSRHNRFVVANEPWYRRLVAKVDRWIIRRAAAVLCHGPYLRQQVLDLGIAPERAIEFDFGFRDLQQSSSTALWDLNGHGKYKVVLFLGRIERNKGVFDLLDACEPLLTTDPWMRLVYAGNGNYLQELREQVASRGLDEKTMLLGMVPHEKLADVICQSHVVVTPTQSEYPEGRCMATMEGLAMGVPVIAPDFGPFPYLVEHETNGMLYIPDSIEDLRRNIARVLDDAALHTRLCVGAKESGKGFSRSTVTFSEAVECGFAMAERGIMSGIRQSRLSG